MVSRALVPCPWLFPKSLAGDDAAYQKIPAVVSESTPNGQRWADPALLGESKTQGEQ
jgi:hypothetical protein